MSALQEFLEIIVNQKASDLHLTVGSLPRIRVNGKIVELNTFNIITSDYLQQIIAPYLNKQQLENLNNNIEVDLTIGINGLGRFRTNLFKQRGNLVAAIRCLPFEIPDINSLGLPETVLNLTMKKKGLILITGGTGSGKSTTLAALIKKISNELNGHIITIEDPIEYLFNHSKAIVNQREIGIDSKSFPSALRSSLRQDPDVVVIGELRDCESMSAALTIAETGHLVFATLHTNSAIGTINRLVDVFPPTKQDIIRMNLSMSLEAIISQQLLPNIENSRSLALEILINTSSIQTLIRDNNVHQIENYILSGSQDGMIRMDDSILSLYNEDMITKDIALSYAHNPSTLEKKLNNF